MARKTLRQIAAGLGLNVGCQDNSCIWGAPGGMATNGGCRCLKERGNERVLLLQMQRVASHMIDVINTVLDEEYF